MRLWRQRQAVGPIAEAWRSVQAQGVRPLVTAIGTMIGVGSVIGITGIAQSAERAIAAELATLSADRVVIRDALEDPSIVEPLAWGDEDLGREVPGVIAVGTRASTGTPVTVTSKLVASPQLVDSFEVQFITATPEYLAAVDAQTTSGRPYNEYHNVAPSRVALVGAGAASRLGFDRIGGETWAQVNGQSVQVIGIVSEARLDPELTDIVLIAPPNTAERIGIETGPVELLATTAPGGAVALADQLRFTLRPYRPQTLLAALPSQPTRLQEKVSADLRGVILGVAAIALVTGAFGVANMTAVSAYERRGEVGLRRALGASRGDIVLLFLSEAIMLSLIAAMAGAGIGMLVVVGTSIANGWIPQIEFIFLVGAPLLGVVASALASLVPSIRAAGFEPADVLRAGVN